MSGYNPVSNLQVLRLDNRRMRSLMKPKPVMKGIRFCSKGIISKSDWDKSISTFEVSKATKQSAYFNVKLQLRK
jgi:hypothetical protein